ncbi:Ras-related protein Rab-3 [Elysia marginata]|uniref:Ras-related protein Rab-3 n=1 Tax=Elysia marginata TaxID=1093978 RepID=A0AAV4JU33_9GAST|nr:Ras-related protein Rab-3 [Elysia marginata]
MDGIDANLDKTSASSQVCIYQQSQDKDTLASDTKDHKLRVSNATSTILASSRLHLSNPSGQLQTDFTVSNFISRRQKDEDEVIQQPNLSTKSNSMPPDNQGTVVSIGTASSLQGTSPSLGDREQGVRTCSVFTSAGIQVTLTDYDSKLNSRTTALGTKIPRDSNIDIQSPCSINRLIDSDLSAQPAPTIKVTDNDNDSQADPTIHRFIASVTARASPTDHLAASLHRCLDSDSDAEDRKLLQNFSASPDRLSPSPGVDHPSSFSNNSYGISSKSKKDSARPHRAVGNERGPTVSSLSSVIKRALSDKRHAHHRPTSPWGEQDEAADNASRLYQSDSYLPALRLQLDRQHSPPVAPYHQDPARFTLPRYAGKNSANLPISPQTLAKEESQCEDSAHSSISVQGGSSTNQSIEFQESEELKTSPPISPLTKGLHCSSLSLYLPPPSIRSLNKMWHRCYSGDSLSGDEHGSEAGKLSVESSTHYDLAAKVILLGDFSVGKTSFLSTLAKARDENGSGFCREYRAGELAEVVFKRQQKRAMIRVMDTGGQERYRSMTSSYYRGVHGCLLVFDVTREDTFNNIIVWHSDLQKYSTDQYVAAILVGTTSHPGERIISPERALKMAESLGIPYMECSPDDASMTLNIVQRLTEKVIKFALRRSSFAIDIKPKSIVLLEEKTKKKFVCLC